MPQLILLEYFLLGVVVAVYALCGLLFFGRKERDPLKLTTAYTSFLFMLLCLKDFVCFFFFDALESPNRMHLISMFDIPIIVPSCYYLCRELVQPGWMRFKHLILHQLGLAAVVGLSFLLPFRWALAVVYGVSISYIVVAIIYVLVRRERYLRAVAEELSYDENVNLSSLNAVVACYFVLFISAMFAYITQDHAADCLYYFTTAVLWVVVCHYINRHDIRAEVKTRIIEDEAVVCDGTAKAAFPFGEKLERLFSEERIYRNAKLTLADVAAQLGTNRTYLSDHLNNGLKLTFFDYVNRFRIAEAEQLLLETDDTLDSIASQVGFASLSTFHRVFKKATGSTPSQFYQQRTGRKR